MPPQLSAPSCPESCTARAVRHVPSWAESSLAGRLTATVRSSATAPVEEVSDSLPQSRWTPEPAGLRFTYGVPFRLGHLTVASQSLPLQDRHPFRALPAGVADYFMKSRD